MVEAVDVSEIQVDGDDRPWYTAITHVSPDHVILTDYVNDVSPS